MSLGTCTSVSANNVQWDKIDIVACSTGNWPLCGVSIGGFLFNLFSWKDNAKITINGYKCVVKLKGRIRRFELVWDGKFVCLFKSIQGSTKGWKNRKTAAKKAVQDFFTKNSDLLKTGNIVPQPISLEQLNDFSFVNDMSIEED